jgi:hypothetical protein
MENNHPKNRQINYKWAIFYSYFDITRGYHLELGCVSNILKRIFPHVSAHEKTSQQLTNKKKRQSKIANHHNNPSKWKSTNHPLESHIRNPFEKILKKSSVQKSTVDHQKPIRKPWKIMENHGKSKAPLAHRRRDANPYSAPTRMLRRPAPGCPRALEATVDHRK